jgi:hypothetical protein
MALPGTKIYFGIIMVQTGPKTRKIEIIMAQPGIKS